MIYLKNSVSFSWPVIIITWLFFSCSTNSKKQEAGADQVAAIVNDMTLLMVHDVTNPPLAARFFAYTMLAGYEVASKNDTSIKSFRGRLNKYPDIPAPNINNYSWRLAAIYAMLETASALQPSGKLLETKLKFITDSCYAAGMNRQTVDSSRAYGKVISKAMLAYAKSDGYRNTSNYSRYTPQVKEGYWYPTPPGFFPAVEPYFNRIRPFTLDSAAQFTPQPPPPYSAKPGSKFYALTKAVYDANKNITIPQREMAAFWDCNPFALDDEGHLQIGIKKISPGAHWMGITGITCKNKQLSFSKTMEIHTVVAITLMDAFMCCWDEKFRSDRIRPETVIRKFLDPEWHPLLQTPPFPEYTSGHSVISTAAAEVLTHFLGDSTAFTDTVEMPYGLAPRFFQSFRKAADEAALSRFYGGIHFMDAIVVGQKQGKEVGMNVIKRLSM
ncbi:MAG: vanadium-dependent haloperoxidase [Chitinophagaceae bacterium]